MKKPVSLLILDGFGLGKDYDGNAIIKANTPNMDRYFKDYPNTQLAASGLDVGLPEGQMGNSEVGHLNIGAGRIVYQSLTRINVSIENGEFFKNQAFLDALSYAKNNNSKIHFLGLFSDGGVHSHVNHFKALFELAKQNGVDAYLHAFGDGRDTAPTSAKGYLEEFEGFLKELNHGSVATVTGRFYAMDRDNIFERTDKAYNCLVNGVGNKANSVMEALEASYAAGVTDEFIKPTVINEDGLIGDKDAVIFANFRPDRAIQISTMLTNIKETPIDRPQLDLNYVCMMHYSEKVKGQVAFGLQNLNNTYGDIISANGLKQLRIAETQKYAHVTFFFDGGLDKEIEGSTRVLVDSPKIDTFDMMPEMSAYEVTDKAISELENGYDTIILNFANCDMVGHTGDMPATIKAVEVVDECVGKVVDAIHAKGGICLITADHGNADKLIDENGATFTAHTTNPVPFIITDKDYQLSSGNLGDIAPTMLELLEIRQPADMTGKSLIKK
jgi:2,3-bisphosphoglycerate-independent phosphoglycerate mutase